MQVVTWECVEVCPYCGGETIVQHNPEKMGWVVPCQHCGRGILLCDECRHNEDNPTGRCDWTEEDGCLGWCFRCVRK